MHVTITATKYRPFTNPIVVSFSIYDPEPGEVSEVLRLFHKDVVLVVEEDQKVDVTHKYLRKR